MPPAALEAFRKAAALDPKDPRARYFLAVEKDLAGDHEGALTAWLALLAETPPGAPWEADLERTIEQVGNVAQHRHAADTGPPRVVDAEHVADVAQAGRRQQRIAERMHADVTVGVPGAAVDIGKEQAQQPARPAGLDDVHVAAHADPEAH